MAFHSTLQKIKVLTTSNKMIYNDVAPYNPSHFIYYFPLCLFHSRHVGSLLVLEPANQSSSQAVWVPKTSPRYDDVLGGLTGLSSHIHHYDLLQ